MSIQFKQMTFNSPLRKKYLMFGMILLCILSFAGCQKKQTPSTLKSSGSKNTQPSQNIQLSEFIGIVTENPTIPDTTTDEAVITTDSSVQTTEQAVLIVTDPVSQTEKSFYVGNYVAVFDNYNASMSMTNLIPGTPVLVKYDSTNLKPDSITISNALWELKNTSNLMINHNTQTITFGKQVYQYNSDVFVFAQNHQIEPSDLHSCDRVRLYGDKQLIYSIIVESGHGYLQLKNASYYIGGYISSTRFGAKISKNMTLTVPEGSHKIQIKKNFVDIVKDIYIEPNETLVIDMAPYKDRIPKKGYIKFNISPTNVILSIGGKLYNYRNPIKLEYGRYKVIATKSGYVSQSGTLIVDSSYKTISITLEKEEEEKEDNSDNASGAAQSTIITTYGADIYIDGQKIGTSPATFTNTLGEHTVTLSKSGYFSKTFSFVVTNISESLNLNYGELIPKSSNESLY